MDVFEPVKVINREIVMDVFEPVKVINLEIVMLYSILRQ